MEVTSLYKTAPIFFITLLLSCNNRITDETNKSLLENDSLVSDTISTINQHQVDTAIISLEQKEVTSIDYKYIYNAFFYEGQPYCLIGTINQFGKEQFKATNKGDKIYYSIPDPKIYYSVENEVKFNNDSYQPSISKGFLLFDSLFYDNNH